MNEQWIGIDHPAIAVSDVEELTNWYCNVLGYERHFHQENPKNIWILRAPDGTLLEVMPQDETTRPDRTVLTSGLSHLALRVNDIEAAIEYLNTHEVSWMGDPVEAIGGGRVRSFTDPDGNMWQVVQR